MNETNDGEVQQTARLCSRPLPIFYFIITIQEGKELLLCVCLCACVWVRPASASMTRQGNNSSSFLSCGGRPSHHSSQEILRLLNPDEIPAQQ